MSLEYCHSPYKPVFENRGIQFYGGGVDDWVIPDKNTIYIRLTTPTEPSVYPVYSIKGIDAPLMNRWVGHKEIHLPIEDYETPTWPTCFFQELITTLRHQKKEGETLHVMVYCRAGHGRTGTVLSCLYGLITKDKDPIGYIRNSYCEFAVETNAQAYYVSYVTGMDVSKYIKKAVKVK